MSDSPFGKMVEGPTELPPQAPPPPVEGPQGQRPAAEILDEHIRATATDPTGDGTQTLPATGDLSPEQQFAYDRYKTMHRNMLLPALANTIGRLPHEIEHLFRVGV